MYEWITVFPSQGPRWSQITDYTRATEIFLRLSDVHPPEYYHIKARTICSGDMKVWDINCRPSLERFFMYLKRHAQRGGVKVRVKVKRRKVLLAS